MSILSGSNAGPFLDRKNSYRPPPQPAQPEQFPLQLPPPFGAPKAHFPW